MARASLPPLTELVIPARYPQTTRAELVTQLVATVAKSSTGFDVERLRAFAMNGNTYLDKGLSLYPRYYRKGEGESSIVAIWSAYTPGADAHLGFLILGETMEPVRLPLYKSPAYFPNGQDVLVLGCRVGYTIEARLVVVGEKSALYTGGSDPFTPCPDMTQP
ncbi:MAG: hypothetical protein HGA86_08645 [Anaerolineaceae bacterium]|nr:hypothetical protein [Anaerolineaceae bacterium]